MVLEGQPLKESFQASGEQVDMSTKDSEQWVPMREPTGTTRQKGKRQNPMDKGPTGLVSGMVHQCKFYEKVCTSESGLTNHINNVHQERQNIFRCCKCGCKYNVFKMYIEHLGTHPKNEYRCHECGKQFKDAHLIVTSQPYPLNRMSILFQDIQRHETTRGSCQQRP